VLITRCAWHRGYHGHPALIGITDWRGLRLGFRDGICSQCSAQLRADLPYSHSAHAKARMDVAGWMPGVGLVVGAVMAAVLLVAQPVHEPPETLRMARAIPAEPRVSLAQPHASSGERTGVAESRSGYVATRQHLSPRVAGPIRPRAPGHTSSSPRNPSQSP
jgi:hypothetical protein